MAYGGNGISYSMIGAGLLRANIEGRQHPLAALFGFSRIGQSQPFVINLQLGSA
jgi:hypothetical protein